MPINLIPYSDIDPASLPPLFPEVQLAWTLMWVEERVQLVKIATYFAQDSNNE